ncbi:MAG: glycoside hydrolase family 127 protein, partial [Chitinophagaceae bacterium]
NNFFYTNPLAASVDYSYHLRWEGGRQPYIKLSNCCPPNAVRTMAEVSDYMYSLSNDGLYVNMYGGNILTTKLRNGNAVKLEQQTDYPWDGHITINIKETASKEFAIYLRIPDWCNQYVWKVNGVTQGKNLKDNTGYVRVQRSWKAGDKIELVLNMPATLIESNPLVEETRNQVTVKRGPVVYCLESPDIKENVFDIAIPATIKFSPQSMTIDKGRVMSLVGEARLLPKNDWNDVLYKQVDPTTQPVRIKLIPYYAWANRGKSDMTVWMPLIR